MKPPPLRPRRVRLVEPPAEPGGIRARQPTQQRAWPFRESLMPGRGWVLNVPPQKKP